MNINPKEVALIGLGPAGVSAAVYLKRYGMIPVAYEKTIVGGKTNLTENIENYPGVEKVKGPAFGMALEKQLKDFDIAPVYDEVTELSLNEDGSFHLVTKKGQSHDYRYVILSQGLGEKPFPIEGEETFHKRGISRCAICDGRFYRGKDVAVVGAGNSAFEEAIYLASLCAHVTLIARRTTFRAQETVVASFKALPNTKILAPYEIVRAEGENTLSSLEVRNKDTGETEKLAVQGLFLYVGEVPNLSFLKIEGLTDEKGYLITDGRRETKQKNLFAIGDCRDTTLRQIVTAAGDGALAATSVHDTYQQSQYTK